MLPSLIFLYAKIIPLMILFKFLSLENVKQFLDLRILRDLSNQFFDLVYIQPVLPT